MREILFRGKRLYNGEWVEGYYAAEPYTKNTYNCGYILENKKDLFAKRACLVDSRTVGQYTGLIDKNGKKIFEGDILMSCGETLLAVYSDTRAGFVVVDKNNVVYPRLKQAVVIGNIHDNPELLEVTE